jgi:hypothetical protein
MKYSANPVIVDAFKIVSVGPVLAVTTVFRDGHVEYEGSQHLALENGENVIASAEMRARMSPAPGDYYVVQSDGYPYLNPKEVFERKYSPQP